MQTQTVLNAGSIGALGSTLTSSFGSNASNSVVSQGSELPYEVVQLKEGDVLYKEGDFPKGLFYVHSGSVKVVVNRNLTRGRTTSPEYVTKLVSPGEFFGYKSLVRGTPSSSMAKAIKATAVWLYPKDVVLNGLQQATPLLKMLLQQAVSDIEGYEITNQLHYLASVQERIAYQLVVLAEKFGVQTTSGISLNLKLTRNEFAQLASTINESLSRHLTEFKNDGLIDLNGKEIIIKDLKGLMSKSGNFKV